MVDEQYWEHGKRYTYVRYKCRCELCKEANAEYKRNKVNHYASLQASTLRESLSADAQDYLGKVTHGLPSSYEWYSCRCTECTEAEARVRATRRFNQVLVGLRNHAA